MKKITHIATLIIASLALTNCVSHKAYTKETQAAITPQRVLQELKDGNHRFAFGKGKKRDLVAQAKQTAYSQYPVAAVLGCIDSRASNELIFDQGIGDIFSVRVAGNVLSNDILGSLEFATAIAGAKVVIVVGHTRCGAVKGACNNAQLGHLTALLEKIKPAILQATTQTKNERKGPAFEDQVAVENVKHVIKLMRSQSPIIHDLERQGKLLIMGALYHLDSRKVEFFNEKHSAISHNS